MKLYSGYVEIFPGKTVLLPRPMTWMEMSRYRFGALPAMIFGTAGVGGLLGSGGVVAGLGKMVGGVPGLAKIGGMGLQAFGQLRGGQATAAEATTLRNIANYNAAVMQREAEAIRQKARFEQVRQAKRGERVKSSLQAALGGAGAVAGTELLEAEQAAELELENLLIGYESEIGAQRAESLRELDIVQAKIYAKQAKAAKKATQMGIGKTLLTGFGDMFA